MKTDYILAFLSLKLKPRTINGQHVPPHMVTNSTSKQFTPQSLHVCTGYMYAKIHVLFKYVQVSEPTIPESMVKIRAALKDFGLIGGANSYTETLIKHAQHNIGRGSPCIFLKPAFFPHVFNFIPTHKHF